MGDQSRSSLINLIEEELDEDDEGLLVAKSKLLGAMAKAISLDHMSRIIKAQALTLSFSKPSVLALNAILLEAPGALVEGGFVDDVVKVICGGLVDRDVSCFYCFSSLCRNNLT